VKEIALQKNKLIIKISSVRENVSTILEIARNFFNQNNVQSCSKYIIVLRELVINAIVHGNMNNPNEDIWCSIFLENGETIIEMKDQGKGFDYKTIDKTVESFPCNGCQRGYKLINALASQIEFNEKGNHVKVVIADK
jgi:anti-sigma regulatory factor (Ser/Thr protein kinase)